MALSVTYNVVNGVILSETRGGVDTIYVPDTNGSLIECRNASGNQTYSAEYWPYGEVQTETGSKANPWGFGGLVGYLRDLGNLLYVRARHLRVDLGRWLTVDPLWPSMEAFGYVWQSPVSSVDPSGKAPFNRKECCLENALQWAGIGLVAGGTGAIIACITCIVLTGGLCIVLCGLYVIGAILESLAVLIAAYWWCIKSKYQCQPPTITPCTPPTEPIIPPMPPSNRIWPPANYGF